MIILHKKNLGSLYFKRKVFFSVDWYKSMPVNLWSRQVTVGKKTWAPFHLFQRVLNLCVILSHLLGTEPGSQLTGMQPCAFLLLPFLPKQFLGLHLWLSCADRLRHSFKSQHEQGWVLTWTEFRVLTSKECPKTSADAFKSMGIFFWDSLRNTVTFFLNPTDRSKLLRLRWNDFGIWHIA